jgi:hypothetical protein
VARTEARQYFRSRSDSRDPAPDDRNRTVVDHAASWIHGDDSPMGDEHIGHLDVGSMANAIKRKQHDESQKRKCDALGHPIRHDRGCDHLGKSAAGIGSSG